jgi:hypothetical protein
MSKTASPLRERELVDMLGPDPELLAIADALAESVQLPARAHARRRVVVFAGAPILAVAAAVTAVVLLWPFSSPPSVLDNALAALGSRPVTHVVLEDSLGSYLLNLRTGSHTPVSGREEIWYRAGQGMFSRRTFHGAPAGSAFLPARLITQGASLSAIFLTSYREQLADHSFHVTGTGHIGTTPVYWIESTPWILGGPSRTQVEQVAISKATYKPLYSRFLLNGHIERGSGTRVLSIETTNSAPVSLRGTAPRFSLGAGYSVVVGYPPLTLKQVRAMRPSPVIRLRIAGLRLVLVARTPVSPSANSPYRVPGASFYYGSLLNTGLPNDKEPDMTGLKPYLAVTEFTRPNALTRFLHAFFPTDGSALIDNSIVSRGRSSATLRKGEIFTVIEGSSDALVVAAARALGT